MTPQYEIHPQAHAHIKNPTTELPTRRECKVSDQCHLEIEKAY